MALSNDLISQFIKATNDTDTTKQETTAYGKIVKQGDSEYVQLDGSDLLTPISSTTVVQDGDRVLVTIKNHTAIVTGDLTTPSASDKEVKEIGNKISEFEIIIADKVTTQDLEAINAYIENIKAVTGKYEELTAITAEIETLQAKYADMEHITAKDAEIINAEIETLKVKLAEFTSISTDDLEAINAEFESIIAYNASFTYVSAEVLNAIDANIKNLETKKLDAETATITYANIDFSNIKEAAIEKLFTDSGIIKDLIMSDGKVTGELVGVTIKGDLIEGNTVKADKLVIKGEDGIYYKLNVDALGETTASSDEKYQNGLDGSAIIAESITAEKIAVDDLVAFGATIGGYHIDTNSLYSGTKSSIDNATNGVYLGDDGQMAIGNANNYLKFYVDENGEYKLEIKFASSDTTLEETVNNIDTSITENATQITSLEAKTDGITASVTEIITIQESNSNSIESLNGDISVLTESVNTKMDSNSVDIAITTALSNGVDKVKTTTKGFTLDDEGLTISDSSSEMSTTIDEDGMEIKRGEDTQLLANNKGVIAYDLHAKTYLIVGENSRFEDYTKNGKKQTGCFWVGETEV